MKIEKVKISSLNLLEKNIRMHPEGQLKELQRSYKMFGQIRPVVIDEKNVILAGNGLYLALKGLGVEQIAIYRANGLTETEKTKLVIADNKTFELGMTNQTTLFEILKDLKLDGDIDVPGFDSDLLETLLMDEDTELPEIESKINDYGVITEDTVQRLTEIGGRKETEAEIAKESSKDDEGAGTEIILSNKDIKVKDDKGLKRPYILCKKCGECIWL